MSTSSHVPSSATAARIDCHHLLRMGHVVDAVERGDQVDASGRPAAAESRVAEAGVGRARPSASFSLGAVERVAGRCRSRRTSTLGNAAPSAAPRSPAPQPTSATLRPAVSLSTTPSSAGSTTGNRNGVVPRLEAALDADRALRAVAVVVVAEPGAEALAARRRALASSAAGGGTCPCRTPGARAWPARRRASGDSQNRSLGRRPSISLAAAWL